MFKNFLLCLLCSANVYSVERTKYDILEMGFTTAVVIGAGVIVALIYSLDEEEFKLLKQELNSGEPDKLSEIVNFGLLTASAVGGICVISQIYPISKEIYEYIFPTEEQKAIQEKVQKKAEKKLKYLQAEAKFVDCMIGSKFSSDVNKFNRPTACEDAAHMLTLCGGSNKVIEVTDIFNEYK